MFRLIAGAIAVAWALAGWVNMPRLANPQSSAAGLAIAGTVVIAYFMGSRTTRASAEASAWAKAEAKANAIAASTSASTSSAQVAVVISSDLGARAVGESRMSGLESAPWMIGATRHAELEQDVVEQSIEDGEGTDAAELDPAVLSGRNGSGGAQA